MDLVGAMAWTWTGTTSGVLRSFQNPSEEATFVKTPYYPLILTQHVFVDIQNSVKARGGSIHCIVVSAHGGKGILHELKSKRIRNTL